MHRRRALAYIFAFALAFLGCHGTDPWDTPLPPPLTHYFIVKVANGTTYDLFVDVYLDGHYYPAGLVPAPAGFIVYATEVIGPYNFEPHQVVVNGRKVIDPAVEFTYAQTFYYGRDYGIATPELDVLLVPPPPPPPTPTATLGAG